MPIVGAIGGRVATRTTYEALSTTDQSVYEHQLLGTSRDIQGRCSTRSRTGSSEGFPETRERYSEAELARRGLDAARRSSTARAT